MIQETSTCAILTATSLLDNLKCVQVTQIQPHYVLMVIIYILKPKLGRVVGISSSVTYK